MRSADWHAQISEDIIDPDRPICDPHHHLWDHPGSRYLLHELLEDLTSGHRIVSTVFVECDVMFKADAPKAFAPIGETEFVNGIAAMSASGQYGECRAASGIVSHADLLLGDNVRPVLEAHVRAAPDRFKGIRHATSWHADERIRVSHAKPFAHQMLDENFLRGLTVLGDMGLSFDAWCYHSQLDEFAEMASQVPGTNIVLDHFGGPLGIGPYEGLADEVFAAWKASVQKLKDLKNVFFKLGGINMKVNGFNWHKREMPPTSNELVEKTGAYYEFCIDEFGADRCMFESNFPVDRESVSYPVLWNAFKKIAQGKTDSEKDQLFLGTATSFYRLPV